MILRYTDLQVPYEPWLGQQPVFRRSRQRYRAEDFRQTKLADNSDRQLHFEQQLRRIADSLNSDCVPFYVRWSGGEETRLDRGCVGHSQARGFIRGLIPDEGGYVSYVQVRS
jgi:hypothetical protein